MICNFCNEREGDAEMVLTNGTGTKKIYICSECARERGITQDPKSIEQALGGLLKELAVISRRIVEKENRLCPVCGTALAGIKASGKVGCPECYSIFKNDIRLLLEKNGVKEIYKGSMPSRLANFRSVLNDRIILRNKLNDALENENYEKAAMYRDYLKALEKTAVSGDADV